VRPSASGLVHTCRDRAAGWGQSGVGAALSAVSSGQTTGRRSTRPYLERRLAPHGAALYPQRVLAHGEHLARQQDLRLRAGGMGASPSLCLVLSSSMTTHRICGGRAPVGSAIAGGRHGAEACGEDTGVALLSA
jgi:hypothetical protein